MIDWALKAFELNEAFGDAWGQAANWVGPDGELICGTFLGFSKKGFYCCEVENAILYVPLVGKGGRWRMIYVFSGVKYL